MDEALRQKILDLRNDSTNENIIKLTEEIFQKTEDFIPNEVVIAKDGEKYKIVEKIEEDYDCIKLQTNEGKIFKKEELSRIMPLTRNDVRRIILTVPKPVIQRVGLPPNIQINSGNLTPPIMKMEDFRQPTDEIVKIDKEVEFPELAPFKIPFINSNETIGNKNLQKMYLRIFTFLEIYNEYFEIEKLTFEEFNNMLLDFQKCINVLSKIFSALIGEKKTKKKKFYIPIENLYKIFFKDFKEENEIKRKEKYIWFTKKISTNNYVEYISSFIEDINSEIQTKNILSFKNISKNYASSDVQKLDLHTKESIKLQTNESQPEKTKEEIKEIRESIKNRLQILFYFVELFGETTEAKILNENIGAFNRDCLKQRNLLLFEIQKLKNKMQEPDFLNSNKILEEIFKKKEKCREVQIQKFYARYNPFLGEYQNYNFYWLSNKILIEKEDEFFILKTQTDWKTLYDNLLNNKFSYKNEKSRALIDNLCTLKELNLFS